VLQQGKAVMKVTAMDFERLCEMSAPWLKMLNDDPLRFDGLFKEGYEPKENEHVVFWFPDYVSCLLASQYLDEVDEDYVVAYDEAVMQWTIVSTYQASWLNA
jgi:hypothetical protein